MTDDEKLAAVEIKLDQLEIKKCMDHLGCAVSCAVPSGRYFYDGSIVLEPCLSLLPFYITARWKEVKL